MPHSILVFILALLVGAAVCFFLGMYALIKVRHAPGGTYFGVAAFLAALFSVGYAFELTAFSLDRIMFWTRIEYIAIPFLPLMILLMCTDYAGYKLGKWRTVLLFSVPAITVILHYTNGYHHLFYTSVGIQTTLNHPMADFERGIWFWVHTTFLYGCMAAAVLILLVQLKTRVFRFRVQIALMITGLLIPIVSDLFYITGWSGGLDVAPISISVASLFHGMALLPYQMFNVTPIARDTVFESLDEGVIVLNKKNVVVDYNRSMRKLLPSLQPHCIGKPLQEAVSGNKQLAGIVCRGEETDYQMDREKTRFHFHVRFTDLLGRKKEVIGKIVTFIDVTERVKLEEKLHLLASIDGLTGVLNRTFFLERAEEICSRMKTGEGSAAMIMFDVDYFKQVNDTFGHEAGDFILKALAETVRGKLREKDLFARYGGEEFVVFLPYTSLSTAQKLAEEIRSAVAETAVFIEGAPLYVTSSFGLAYTVLAPEETVSPVPRLMKEADLALYQAKKSGRNCVQVYTDAL